MGIGEARKKSKLKLFKNNSLSFQYLLGLFKQGGYFCSKLAEVALMLMEYIEVNSENV